MRLTVVALAMMPGIALAAGGGEEPPPQTPTTKTCKGVKVWSEKKRRCVKPENAALDADTLYGAVRELAYADRIDDAQGVLRVMPDQSEDRVLTYWGFTHRKLGNDALAVEYYTRALAVNPDNLLARSYMGQGDVAAGRIGAAKAQLLEIRARGGAGGWPEQALADSIQNGTIYSY